MNADKNLLDAMSDEFKKYTAVKRAVLFGSRARGDNTERSDYDVAIYGSLSKSEQNAIRHRFSEELPTLHKIDLVFIQAITPSKFTENIEKEGIEIYDAKI